MTREDTPAQIRFCVHTPNTGRIGVADRACGPTDLSQSSLSQPEALVPCAEDDDFDDYEPHEIGCVNCDGGWKHGCCDDLCYACNEPQWCDFARACSCNPHGEVL